MNTSFKLLTAEVEINNIVFELTQYNTEEEAEERTQLNVRDQEEKEISSSKNKVNSPSKLKKVFSKVANVEAIKLFFDGQRTCNEGTSKSSEWEDHMIKAFSQKSRK